MREEVLSFVYDFRHSFIGIGIIAAILLLASLTTALGAGSVFDSRTAKHTQAAQPNYSSGSLNVVTNGISNMADTARRASLTVGTSVYSASRHIHSSSVNSAKAVGNAAVVGITGVRDGVVYVATAIGRGVGAATLAVARTPGNVYSSVSRANANAVGAVIRPADSAALTVPTIDAATSSEILEYLGAQERAKIAALLEEQKVANQRLVGTIIAGDPARGGYPAKWDNARQDSLVDSWGMYNRECVSYAAWKVHEAYGTMPYWGGVGNANLWVRNAQRAGIPTSATPKPQSVAISMMGYYGHAMWVEKVAGDMIYVSQYNWDLNGRYSEMWARADQFTYIYFN